MILSFLRKHYPNYIDRFNTEARRGYTGTLEEFVKEYAPDIYEAYTRSVRPLIVLTALLNGMEIKHAGQTWVMDIDYRVCAKGQSINSKTGESKDILLILDMGEGIALSHFVRWAARFTDEEIMVIGANLALNGV